MEAKLTKAVARKVLKVVDAGLVKGLGIAEPGKMCVEAAVNYALGLPHGDQPQCVGEAVRRFKICLNDAYWPSDEDRTKGMRKLAIAQLGSNTIDQGAFADIVVLKTIQEVIPLTFRYAIANSKTLTDTQHEEFEACAKECEGSPDLDTAKVAVRKARTTAAAAYAAYAAAAAYADAADAAAAAAAYAAAYAAYAAYAADTAAAKTFRLDVLTLCARIGLDALKALNSPGCKWLDLCD